MREIIDNLCVAEKISSKGDQQERTKCVKRIGELVTAHAGVEDALRKYIDPEAFAKAFKAHVDKVCPKLPKLAAEVGDITDLYCKTVKEHFATTAAWLWNVQNVDGELNLVCAQYKVISYVQKILAMMGIEDTPIFSRNRVSNQKEQTEMIMLAANYLDDQTILEKLPWITVDEVESILARTDKDSQEAFVTEEPVPDEETEE
jgi:hypothetical protein